ncbi:MurR/RpiR family transcriptional regulator [Sphingomonas sp. 37zxx]|uniref:MurR/RpiR family transcriptional regulator n=1 Tax=Sphingomonas sp. 37zxx TaxID=1550073 RepID=UPI00053BF8E4|nr:MurR/RpiR family transcriptional regulator [Sphingomonas sp. 37zxx]
MLDMGDTSQDLLQRLKDNLDAFTPTERVIANFILINRGGIAFETANSIAAKLNVSSIMVGRFSRKMGYRHFKDLKSGLRMTMSGVPWLVGDEVAALNKQDPSSRNKRSLELELAAIIEVYEMAESEGWKQIVALLANCPQVHIAGFQTERGIATILAHTLQYARTGITLVDSTAGNYHEIFAAGPGERCVVIIDRRRYSQQAYDLAAGASRAGLPVIMITDKFCDWIRKFTPNVIAVSTEVDLFWNSQVAMSCVANLLFNDVVSTIGPKVEERLHLLSSLYQTHVGHVGAKPVRKRSLG